MTNRQQYASDSASAARLGQFWSAHVDALDGHLSSNLWILVAITVVLIAYPIGQMAIPAVLHSVVPDVVRTVLTLS